MAMQRSQQGQQQQAGRSMTAWTPFNEMERWMEETTRGWPSIFRRAPVEGMAWMPAIDVYEKDDGYQIKVELPGVKKEDVNVSMMGDTVTISGERRTEETMKSENYIRSEMAYGKFSRSITLPTELDANKSKATYENGILMVEVPKIEGAKAKKVEITVR